MNLGLISETTLNTITGTSFSHTNQSTTIKTIFDNKYFLKKNFFKQVLRINWYKYNLYPFHFSDSADIGDIII